jgi:hypothetical protein
MHLKSKINNKQLKDEKHYLVKGRRFSFYITVMTQHKKKAMPGTSQLPSSPPS